MSTKAVGGERAAVRYLEVHYEGYFMGRIATDPDPTLEPRGKSGYTVALAGEEILDQTVRLQFPNTPGHLREPAARMDGKTFDGVKVTGVAFEGEPIDSPLIGAPVQLIGSPGCAGPVFESRNNLVGSDDTFGFVINPFHLEIGSGEPLLTATAAINPADPKEQIWEVVDPKVYVARLPVAVSAGDDEINMATGVYDYYEYFRARREWLQIQIDGTEQEVCAIESRRDRRSFDSAEPDSAVNDPRYVPHDRELVRGLRAGSPAADHQRQEPDAGCATDATLEALELRRQGYISRLFQLEAWGDRVISKMGAKVSWDHFVTGVASAKQRVFKASGSDWKIDCERPWRVHYWFGGWDGDLLLGFHRGRLYVPSLPAN